MITFFVFFVDNADQKSPVFQNLLVCIHSYSSPQSIWTSRWLDWKTLFVKLQTDNILSAKFDNDMSTFFPRQRRSKLPSVSEPSGCIHSYSSPQSIWTDRSLDWNPLFVKLHSDTFFRKIWQRHDYFFRFFCRQPRSKNSSVSEPTRMHTLHTETFIRAKFDKEIYTRKFWQWHEYFFRRPPWWKTLSVSEPTRMRTHLL